jgi:hypothetical protein
MSFTDPCKMSKVVHPKRVSQNENKPVYCCTVLQSVSKVLFMLQQLTSLFCIHHSVYVRLRKMSLCQVAFMHETYANKLAVIQFSQFCYCK